MNIYDVSCPSALEKVNHDRVDEFRFGYRFHNPIESTFATVRHRTRQTKGCGSRTTALTMVFKLATQAERHWRRLNSHKLITNLIDGN